MIDVLICLIDVSKYEVMVGQDRFRSRIRLSDKVDSVQISGTCRHHKRRDIHWQCHGLGDVVMACSTCHDASNMKAARDDFRTVKYGKSCGG